MGKWDRVLRRKPSQPSALPPMLESSPLDNLAPVPELGPCHRERVSTEPGTNRQVCKPCPNIAAGQLAHAGRTYTLCADCLRELSDLLAKAGQPAALLAPLRPAGGHHPN